MDWTRDNFRITDDNKAVDIDYMTNCLNTTYWAEERSREIVKKSVSNSVVLTLFDDDQPIGFSGMVGDNATYTWICDVYVDPGYRGQGLGVWLVECTVNHPFNDVRLSMLATRDAFALYEKFEYRMYERTMIRRKD